MKKYIVKEKFKEIVIDVVIIMIILLCSKIIVTNEKELDDVGKYIKSQDMVYRSTMEIYNSIFSDGLDRYVMDIQDMVKK